MLLNLGGDALTESIATASAAGRLAAVQTSLDVVEGDRGKVVDAAQQVANELFERLRPAVAVVTIGRFGAVGRTEDGQFLAGTDEARVRFVHGAGAAFSAGFANALLAGRDTQTALEDGCAVGTAHCQGKIEAHRLGSEPRQQSRTVRRSEVARGGSDDAELTHR